MASSYSNLGLGDPAFWEFAIQTPSGSTVSSCYLRIPPQNVDVQRPIRSQVSQDLGLNPVVVQDGLGLPRWTLSGTHGAGVSHSQIQTLDVYGQVSAGLAARYKLLNLFELFATQNRTLIQGGDAPNVMLMTVYGGGPAEMPWDQWEIMPEEAPRDRRSSASPLAWNWSLSFWGLKHVSETSSDINKDFLSQAILSSSASSLSASASTVKTASLLSQFRTWALSIQSFVSKVTSLASAITSSVAEAEDIANGVLNLALLVSQTASSLLTSLESSFTTEADYISSEARSLRTAILDIKLTAGTVARTAARPTSVSSSSAYSSARPTSVSVRVGDTIQALASTYLGDASEWTTLATLNGLVYPYLDFSGTNGAADSSLQGSGIATPATTDSLYVAPGATIGLGGKVLGAGDTMTLPLVGGAQAPADPIGWDTEDGGTTLANGNPLIVQGQANLSAALLRRLRCPAGWLPYHPDYGAGLKSYIGSTLSVPTVLALRRDVANQLIKDPRVIKVTSVAATVSGDAITVQATVQTPLGETQIAGNLVPTQASIAAQAS